MSPETNRPVFNNEYINLAELIVFPQPRVTFELDRIEELARGIAKNGLVNPITVCLLTYQELYRYIATINDMWGTTFSVDSYASIARTDGKYCVLLAGERRMKAIMLIERSSPDVFPDAIPNQFELGIPARTLIDIDPLRALSIQLNENIHDRVASHEEAEHIVRFWNFRRRIVTTITVPKFAMEIGKSDSTVYKALAYSQAPGEIKNMVISGSLSYEVACDLSRAIIDGELPEIEAVARATSFALQGLTAEEAKLALRKTLEQLRAGQLSLLDETHDSQTARRQAFELSTILTLYRFIRYFEAVHQIVYDHIGESEFSRSTATNMFVATIRLLDKLKEILPHLPLSASRRLLFEQRLEIIERITISKLLSIFPDDESLRRFFEHVACDDFFDGSGI